MDTLEIRAIVGTDETQQTAIRLMIEMEEWFDELYGSENPNRPPIICGLSRFTTTISAGEECLWCSESDPSESLTLAILKQAWKQHVEWLAGFLQTT